MTPISWEVVGAGHLIFTLALWVLLQVQCLPERVRSYVERVQTLTDQFLIDRFRITLDYNWAAGQP